jgi:DNA-binding CsgD family transcriptional regulator
LIEGLEDEARRVGLPGGIGIATIVARTVRGDLDAAVAACADARTSPHLLARTAALELIGTALWRAAPNDTARALLAEARDGYEDLGATPAAERAAAVTEPEGTARRKAARKARPRFGWEALTPAELAVLDLVVDAKRNGEIAEILVLSKRTVESHISSILTKVGVASRVELVVEAGRRAAASG